MGQSCTRPKPKDLVEAKLLLPQGEGQGIQGRAPNQEPQVRVQESFLDQQQKDVDQSGVDRGRTTNGLDSTRHPQTEADYSVHRLLMDGRDADFSIISKQLRSTAQIDDFLNSRDESAFTRRKDSEQIGHHIQPRLSAIGRERMAALRPMDHDQFSDQSKSELGSDKEREFLGDLSLRGRTKSGQKSSNLSNNLNEDNLDLDQSLAERKGKLVFVTPSFNQSAYRQRPTSFGPVSKSSMNSEHQVNPLRQIGRLAHLPTIDSAKESLSPQQRASERDNTEANNQNLQRSEVKQLTANFNFDLSSLSPYDRHPRLATFGTPNVTPFNRAFFDSQLEASQDNQDKRPMLPFEKPDNSSLGPFDRPHLTVGQPTGDRIHHQTHARDNTLEHLATIDEVVDKQTYEAITSQQNPSIQSGIAVFSGGYIPEIVLPPAPTMAQPQTLYSRVNHSHLVIEHPFFHQSFTSLNDPLAELDE